MNYIGKFISNFKDAYNEINGATLTGAIDAVVVRQEDGSFISSPFHVRFGKIGVLRSREKVVDIEINGEPVDIHMKLGETGEAFFVEELEEGAEVSPFLGTSPLPQYLEEYEHKADARSQDSGVEAEEIFCKSFKVKHIKDTNSDVIKVACDFNARCDTKIGETFETTVQGSSVVDADGLVNLVSDLSIETKSHSRQNSLLNERSHSKDSTSSVRTGCSPSVDVPKQESWREDLVRSKSLTSESPVRVTSRIVLDGQGSKTDVEDMIKVNRTSRRRRKKKAKHRMKVNESQSSENSTTSETADLSSLSVTGIASSASHEPIFLMEEFCNQQGFFLNTGDLNEKCAMKGKNWGCGRRSALGPDFHPFSDTDISPPPSPSNSRSNTPVKSDTEYECEKQKSELSETSAAQSRDNKWSWTWGELPTPPIGPRPNVSSRQNHTHSHVDNTLIQEGDKIQTMTEAENEQRSMLGNMFSFMRATKKARHNPESEGIYLDDLNLDELEPEVAALYFPRNSMLHEKQDFTQFRSVAKDEDAESGNGTSLPQSPHSVEGAIGGLKVASLDSDFEDACRHGIFDYKGYHDLAFSLCGALHEHLEDAFPESLFMQSLVTYDDFCEKPNIVENPNLVVRIDGKYMTWGAAAPQIMSLALFQRPLPPRVVENLTKENSPKEKIRKRAESKGYSWFPWGRGNEAQSELNNGEQRPPNSDSAEAALLSTSSPPSLSLPSTTVTAPPDTDSTADITTTTTTTTVATTTLTTHQINSTSTEVTETHHEAFLSTVSSGGGEEVSELHSEVVTQKVRQRNESSESDDQDENGRRRRYRKTIRLSSDQIKKLNLRNGSNEVMFSVTTAYQGTTRCKCHIYLWNYDEKIVVSDIDGTITKSDVLGHILPIIGKDWAQGGVAQLFTKIKNNGYNFLYLSARAIGQARITRDYLRSIKQGDVSLPDGPLLLNPTSLIRAFHREVIERKPEEFKISCLRDIKALFPNNENPFYAGYGNRINDVWAYSAVGIPIQRIFTINHKGELKHELTQTFQTTYVGQVKIVDETFPPIKTKMVPRDLVNYMYSDEEEDEEWSVDLDYDSEWDGFPTAIDAMSIGA